MASTILFRVQHYDIIHQYFYTAFSGLDSDLVASHLLVSHKINFTLYCVYKIYTDFQNANENTSQDSIYKPYSGQFGFKSISHDHMK